jgi:hypothetical protein
MRPAPKLTLEAIADVAQTAAYYNAQRTDLGTDFMDEVEDRLSHIREAPLLSTLVDPPIRRALLRRFPFGIFYVAGTATDADVIVAVVDLRQDPEVIRQAYSR